MATEHPVALEQFRHAHQRNRKHYHKVDRDKHLCRSRAEGGESPDYALLVCTGHTDLVTRHSAFFERLEDILPNFVVPFEPRDVLPALRKSLAAPNTVAEMAEFTCSVFSILTTSVELVCPLEFVVDLPRNRPTSPLSYFKIARPPVPAIVHFKRSADIACVG
ncbi:hypothetical protein PENSPDRAFT_504654 [Peniophora sp. CONT]|nr:hypothetical protein PENSPDRAFT_504654 [Peniophora sp. CONT]